MHESEAGIPQSGKEMFCDRSDEWIVGYPASSTLISSWAALYSSSCAEEGDEAEKFKPKWHIKQFQTLYQEARIHILQTSLLIKLGQK